MELPSNVPLPFLDLHCSPECAADCDGIHISWKSQEATQQTVGATGISSGLSWEPEGVSSIYAAAPFTGACGWDPAGGSNSNCSALPIACTDGHIVTADFTSSCSLPVIPCGKNSTATVSESGLSSSFKVAAGSGHDAWQADVLESLPLGAMTHVSISHGGGYVSMLTQPSLTGGSFTQSTTTAVNPSPVSFHDQIHSVVMNPAAAALPICEPQQQCMATPSAAHHQIPSKLSTPADIHAPGVVVVAAAAAAAAAAPAALPVNMPTTTFQSHYLQQEAPLLLRPAQTTLTESSGGSTRDRTLGANREGTLYDVIVSGRFKRKGSASWWGDDSIAEAPTTHHLKRQCLVGGNEPGFIAPDSSATGSGSLTAGSRCAPVYLDLPRTRVEAPASIPVVGSTAGSVGSAAVSRPPAVATEGAALLDPLPTSSAFRVTQGAAQPAQSAQPTLRDHAHGSGLGPDWPPIQRRSAAEKIRRHRISAGFKRLEKVLPPLWMRQKHQSKMSSRTDMSSLLDAAVDYIRELEDRKAELALAYLQQVS
ncbi:unnamed protein product [Closterium sp. NIES-54]